MAKNSSTMPAAYVLTPTHAPILSRLSDTAFIRGRRSGSASTHLSATWNAATTSFRAPASRSTEASASSDSGRPSSNPCRTHLTISGACCCCSSGPGNDADEEDADGEPCSGVFPVSSSSRTTPKEYTSDFWLGGRAPGARASGARYELGRSNAAAGGLA
uniref:Uncharacterized protein n=1 Tax=Arundo donax TaxID=35708 RepID=A0A0A9D8S4_ARUDO